MSRASRPESKSPVDGASVVVCEAIELAQDPEEVCQNAKASGRRTVLLYKSDRHHWVQ
jgi:hypothetical protein